MKSLIVGADDSNPAAGITYNFPAAAMVSSWGATESTRVAVVPHAMVVSRLCVTVFDQPGTGTYVFTLMKNGVATGLTVTLTGTTVVAKDNSNTVTFAAGDTMSLQCNATGTLPTQTYIRWSMRQEATDLYGVLTGTATSSGVAAVNYLGLFGQSTFTTTESDFQAPIPCAGTFKNLYVVLSGSPGTGKNYIITVRKNGVDTALTTTIADSATTGNDITHSFTVAAGDKVTIAVTPTGTPTARNLRIGMSFDPVNDGESFLVFADASTVGTSTTGYQQPLGRGNATWNSTETTREIQLGAIDVKAVYVDSGATSPGSGKSYAISIRKNHASALITASLANTNTTANTSGSGTYAQGDMASIESVPSGNPTAIAPKVGILLKEILGGGNFVAFF